MKLKSFLPILSWSKRMEKGEILGDFNASILVWILLVPQAMAYAFLAGMPPIFGLYAAFIPLLIYGLLGSSMHLSIGPVAISSILVFDGISKLAEPFSDQYISLVLLTGLLVGLIQVVASILRAGFLVNFLSNPVISGFSSAAAIIIAISQLPQLLGIETSGNSTYSERLIEVMTHLSELHIGTFLMGVVALILMLILKRFKKIPEALIMVIVSILLVRFLKLENAGFSIVGDVPKGLPSFIVPDFSLENIRLVMPTVLTVSVIGIVETISIAKIWERKHNSYKVLPSQELLAIGMSKIGGAFFQAMPSSASFSRSAINSEGGARTQLSSLITFVLVTLTLLFLTPLFYYLPKAILAAIILLSVVSLFDYKEAIRLYKVHMGDFAMMMVTFIVTLILGIEEGILSGVVLSAAMMLYRNARPGIVVLGRYPNSFFYRNVDRFQEVEQIPGCLIIRFDNELFFANSSIFRDTIERLVRDYDGTLEAVVIECSSIHDMDSTGMRALEEVKMFLDEKGVSLFISGMIGTVRDCVYQSGLMDTIGQENFFVYINEAVENFQADSLSGKKRLANVASQSKYRK